MNERRRKPSFFVVYNIMISSFTWCFFYACIVILKTVTGLLCGWTTRKGANKENGVTVMAAEYTAEPGIRYEEESSGRTDAGGSQGATEDPTAHDLRVAAAEDGHEPAGVENDTELSGDLSQIKDRVPHEKSTGEGFYKSQEEVDRAFGYRLASERRRWEREHREELQRVRLEAKESATADSWLPQKQMYADEYAYFGDLVAQGNALAGANPSFDLLEEINNNAAFERMVANGVSVAEAYETVGQAPQLVKEQSIRQDERRQALEEMESRTQSLPPVDRNPGLSGPVLDVTRISEEELARLAERVRKGERVVI